MSLPDRFKKFFWDVSFADLDKVADYYFILERLLEYGDDEAVRWLLRNYSKKDLMEVITSSRRLSPKTGHFWKCYYQLPEDEIRCLHPPSHRKDNLHWNY